MKKLTQIEELFNEYQTLNEYEGSEIYNKAIYELALNSKQEKESLIKLFHNEIRSHLKINLADILTKLHEKAIIPFLIEYIKNKSNQYPLIAAYYLIELNYEPVVPLFLELAEDLSIPRHWLYDELFFLDTPLAYYILIKLMEKHDDIRDDVVSLLKDKELLEERREQNEARKKNDPTYPF